MISNPVLETQRNHVSVRSFTDKDVSVEMLNDILSSARRSPTSSNMQAYSIVVVRDPLKKAKLAELAGGQQHIEQCPVFLTFCADLHRLEQACEMHDVEMNNNLESFLMASIDASLVGMSVQTGAESCGLGAVMVGGMRNHPDKVAELLGLPKGVYVVYGMSMGWTDQRPPQKPRLPEQLVIHHETYHLDHPHELIQAHDRELGSHYERLGMNQHPAAWSGPVSKSLSRSSRSSLRETLDRMGFHV